MYSRYLHTGNYMPGPPQVSHTHHKHTANTSASSVPPSQKQPLSTSFPFNIPFLSDLQLDSSDILILMILFLLMKEEDSTTMLTAIILYFFM